MNQLLVIGIAVLALAGDGYLGWGWYQCHRAEKTESARATACSDNFSAYRETSETQAAAAITSVAAAQKSDAEHLDRLHALEQQLDVSNAAAATARKQASLAADAALRRAQNADPTLATVENLPVPDAWVRWLRVPFGAEGAPAGSGPGSDHALSGLAR